MNMTKQQNEIAELEKKFWDSMIDRKPDMATRILSEPAIMVSSHGVMKFDHAEYSKMASNDAYTLVEYKMADMDVVFPADEVAVATYRVTQKMEVEGKPIQMEAFDTSTWVKLDGEWRCAMHTESEKNITQQ